MFLVRVASGVLNQTPLAWEENRDRILGAIEQARAEQASVLCLPELCISGYGCEDAFLSPAVQQAALEMLQEIVPHTRGLIVAVGLPLRYEQVLLNAACLMVDGQIAGFVAKQFLAGDGLHYEPRWFSPWPAGRQTTVEVSGQPYPLGDLIFECGGVRIGFEICEDAWVARRPGIRLAEQNVDLILNPSASHFAFGKWQTRQRFVLEGSRAFRCGYIYSNLVGNEAGRAIYDGGAMIAVSGQPLALNPRFSYRDVQVVAATINLATPRMQRSEVHHAQAYLPQMQVSPIETQPSRSSTTASVASLLVRADFSFPELLPTKAEAPQLDVWETGPDLEFEEFARAVSLGMLDYLRKSRAQGFVVSLSGGADSAACSTLVYLGVQLAIQELGITGFLQKLAAIAPLQQATSPAEVMAQLLICVYQATSNSGEVTRSAASSLAHALGASYLEWNIDALVQEYTALVSTAVQRPLSWETDDVALQNIQARSRSPGVWMLANLRGGLLLATSNRSEASVGYATMDGDTSGGLSPLAGIDKDFIRRWLVWLETQGPSGLEPMPVLAAVNQQQPTAELRPQSQHQTDEADLMPYEVLNAVEQAVVYHRQSPVEALRQLIARFPQYQPRQLGRWVERFYRLWSQNQWKRERYAPSFQVDDYSVDPKTWCRFPILSGSFGRELAELNAYLEKLE